MTKAEFIQLYNLSRGQVDRLLAKADKRGKFYVPECGWFIAKKIGKGKTAPLDIVPERAAKPRDQEHPKPPPLAPSSDLLALSKEELDRRKVIAEIEKIQQVNEKTKRAIRKEAMSELFIVIAQAFAPLTFELENLRLPIADLDRLRGCLIQSLDHLAEAKRKYVE